MTTAELVSIAVTPPSPSAPLGETREFSAIGTYTDDSTHDLTAQVTWKSSDTTVATIGNAAGSEGIATTMGTGSITISATDSDTGISSTNSGESATLEVTIAELISLAVTPPSPSIPLGNIQQFNATGTYTDGSTRDLTTQVTWKSSETAVATTGNEGLATTVAGTGFTTISATDPDTDISSADSGESATLEVTAAALVSVAVTPPAPSIPLGDTQQFGATGTYTDGSTRNLTTQVTWESSDTTVATIGNEGLAITMDTGPTIISATDPDTGISSAEPPTLEVTTAELVSIAVTPLTPSIPLGNTQQFSATGTYTDGSTQNLTAQVNWASSDTAVATIDSVGLVTTEGTGPATISVTDPDTGISSMDSEESATLEVTAEELISIAITPPAPSLSLGETQQFNATGTYTDGSTQDLTVQATWKSSNTAVAAIDNAAGNEGMATTMGTGSITISATDPDTGISSADSEGSATLEVTAAELVSVAVTPLAPSVPLGETQQFSATGTYTDDSTQNLTTQVTWASSDTTVATIDNEGLAITVDTGATTVSATDPDTGVSSGDSGESAALEVATAELVSISVAPPAPSIPLGDTQQFSATGTYTDDSTQDFTAQVTWRSSDTAVATIDNEGLATTVDTGPTTVSATDPDTGISSGDSGKSATLEVTATELTSISITPSPSNVPMDGTQQFTAMGTYTDGSTYDITAQVSWDSSDTTVATISNAGGTEGVAAGLLEGRTTITTTDSTTGLSATARLTVRNIVITEIGSGYHVNASFWVEMFNAGAKSINLSSYNLHSYSWDTETETLAGIYNFSLPNIMLSSGDYVIVRGDPVGGLPDTGQTVYLRSANTYIPYWGSGNGFVELLRNSVTMDFVRFGEETVSPTTAGAWTSGTAPALPSHSSAYGYSIARNLANIDTNDPADWISRDYATPGGPNDVTCTSDSDIDGIPDCSEKPGSTFAGLPLYEWGARAGQTDLFVEVDYMPPEDDGGIPWQVALQKVADVFAGRGIAVHFDVGDLFDQTAGISPENFDLGGGNEVPSADGADFGRGDLNPVSPGEADVRLYKIRFMDARRKPVFHYMLFASRLTPSGCDGYWGKAELIGNELIICMGGSGLSNNTSTAENYLLNYQSAVVFHELGHNLGLLHGGLESKNYKPNYISSMNYLYSNKGLPTIGNKEGDRYYRTNFPGDTNCGEYQSNSGLFNPPSGDPANFIIDYSDGDSADLDESAVNENIGLGRWNSEWVDFNCNGALDGSLYSINLNPADDSTSSDLYSDYNDWANLEFIYQRNIWDDLF